MLLKLSNFRIRVTKLHLLQSLEEITESIPILAHILILLRSNIRSRGDGTRDTILGLGAQLCIIISPSEFPLE